MAPANTSSYRWIQVSTGYCKLVPASTSQYRLVQVSTSQDIKDAPRCTDHFGIGFIENGNQSDVSQLAQGMLLCLGSLGKGDVRQLELGEDI